MWGWRPSLCDIVRLDENNEDDGEVCGVEENWRVALCDGLETELPNLRPSADVSAVLPLLKLEVSLLGDPPTGICISLTRTRRRLEVSVGELRRLMEARSWLWVGKEEERRDTKRALYLSLRRRTKHTGLPVVRWRSSNFGIEIPPNNSLSHGLAAASAQVSRLALLKPPLVERLEPMKYKLLLES